MTTGDLAYAFSLARAVLANVGPDQYDDPTPCASWDVRRLISHYVGASYWFADCVNNGVAPEDDTTESTDYTQNDLLAAYDTGIAAAIEAFEAPGAQDKIVKLPFGELPGRVFMGIATNDVFTHAWDLARATGQPTDLDPEFAAKQTEAARLFVSDAIRGPDGSPAPFGPEQPAPDGASAADRHAAFLGRSL
ncbi:MAG: TIGR03086 family protein [Acidimicrobiia bacterium]|nr:TIGR03086 family protein [Acidimicrobiia bacterium]